MKTDTLPDKLSDLLEIALDDLELVEADPHYAVNMNQWHNISSVNGICHVCLAGAVMAGTLRADPGQHTMPIDYPRDVRRKLLTLDAFAMGDIHMGFRDSSIPPDPDFPDIDIPEYSVDPEGFKQTLRDLIPELRAKNY